MADVKNLIKSQLLKIENVEYRKSLKEKTFDFDAWISKKEEKLEKIDMSVGRKASISSRERMDAIEELSNVKKKEQPFVAVKEEPAEEKPKKEIAVKGLSTKIEIDELSFIKNIEKKPVEEKEEESVEEEPVIDSLEVIEEKEDEEAVIDPEEYKNSMFVTRYGSTTFRIVPYNSVTRDFTFKTFIEDIIVFTEGELTRTALPLIAQAFSNNSKLSVVYGDEDIADLSDDEDRPYGEPKAGSRTNPYFKPDWSPNKFLHHFYFCNMVALKRASFRELDFSEGFKNDQSGARYIYHTVLRFVTESEFNMLNSVKHIDEILIHARNYDNNDITDASAGRFAKGLKCTALSKLVTVVIPSKDNPDMLRSCIASVYNVKRSGIELDVIVVDNGSSSKNREKISKIAEEYPFRYEYVKAEFNFSAMCNLGASHAQGDFILFLNDDVLITEPGTLNELVNEAEYRFTGAVGAKLLYPDSSMIQHAGVINNRIGPVHKLQFMDDRRSHYNGFNRYPQNLLAVTAACLMMRRDLFVQSGGFNEDLRVAFNDVDICFRLFEAGYKNVCLNDISLIHKESFTRGSDSDSKSLARLSDERNILYTLHPSLKAYDPYYGKYNVNDCLDTRFVPANTYEFERNVTKKPKCRFFKSESGRLDQCLKVTVEYAGKLEDYSFNQFAGFDKGLYIQGYAMVIGSDNVSYEKKLLLKAISDNSEYAIDFEPVYRDDLKNNCPDQTNVELSGFGVILESKSLPKGEYTVGAAAVKKYSKEVLYNYSEKRITIK